MIDILLSLGLAISILIVFFCISKLVDRWMLNRRLLLNSITLEEIISLRRNGTLVFDTIYGASIGFGQPVVWWIENERLLKVDSCRLSTAPIVKISQKINSVDELKEMHPNIHVCSNVELSNVDYFESVVDQQSSTTKHEQDSLRQKR